MSNRIGLIVVAASLVVLAGCPLPFEFVPESTTGDISASVDPSNPSITSAPVVSANEKTSGAAVASFDSTLDLDIALATDTRGATIFYTTDGSDPIPGLNADPYEGPIAVHGHEATADIRAIAIGPGMYPSLVAEQLVVVTYNAAATPAFSVAPGNYQSDQTLTLTALEAGEASTSADTEIWYTILNDVGVAPDPVPGAAGTQLYSGSISIAGTGTAVSIAAVAVRPERTTSEIARGTWTIGYPGTAQPTITPTDPAPRYNATTVVIASTTENATIYYTLDGTAPTTDLTGVPSPVTVPVDGQTTIRAIAISDTTAVSAEQQVTLSFEVGPVSITPTETTFVGAVSVSLATETDDAQIFYTIDGSDPRSSGSAQLFTGSFGRESDTTVRAFATRDGYAESAVAERTYTASSFTMYDDFADGEINGTLWIDGSQLGGRVFEASTFVYPSGASVATPGTINIYGRVLPGGQTGNGVLTTVGVSPRWQFDIVDEYMGAQAGGAQGWAIYAIDPAGVTVQVVNHWNDIRNHPNPGEPGPSPNFSDGSGTYEVRSDGTVLEVFRNGGHLRTINVGVPFGTFQLRFRAQNAYGVNVSEAGLAIDNVLTAN